MPLSEYKLRQIQTESERMRAHMEDSFRQRRAKLLDTPHTSALDITRRLDALEDSHESRIEAHNNRLTYKRKRSDFRKIKTSVLHCEGVII